MKKSLLLIATSFAFFTSYAQDDCATALAITASGTITATAPAGTVEPFAYGEVPALVTTT